MINDHRLPTPSKRLRQDLLRSSSFRTFLHDHQKNQCKCIINMLFLERGFEIMRTPIFKTSHCVKSVQMRSFFWSVISCIRSEYGDLLRKCPYSVRIKENTDQKKLCVWTFFIQCHLKMIARV